MSRPFATKQGSYYLNVKVPLALRPLAKGQRVSLPVDGEHHSVVVGDKVVLSLRTKEAKVARERFPLALEALNAFFKGLGQPPQTLSRVQTRALAGEVYRDAVKEIDSSDAIADDVEALRDELADAADHYKREGADEKSAELSAAIDMYDQRALMAWGLKHGDPLLSRETLLEGFFGPMLDSRLARHQLKVDTESRLKLLNATEGMAQAFIETAERRLKANDFRDPVGEALPTFDPPKRPAPPTPKGASTRAAKITVEVVFERWKKAHAEKRKPATFRRYGPSLASFHRFWGERDIAELQHEDVWAWAFKREHEEGIDPATINRNDLVAISSVLKWASSFPGGRLIKDNPATGVSAEPKLKTVSREKAFRNEEVSAVLLAARHARFNPKFPRASASRRWSAWICAYTGARIQEVCWLSKEDIRQQEGMWVIHFPTTKTGVARTVPMHCALIEEGLLTFAKAAPTGFLFVGDTPQKEGASRSIQEQRASELAEWTREQVKLDDELSPNHAWRTTFVTRAEDTGISKRFSNAITGHNFKKDVSDGYFQPRLSALKKRMDRFPVFELETVKEDKTS